MSDKCFLNLMVESALAAVSWSVLNVVKSSPQHRFCYSVRGVSGTACVAKQLSYKQQILPASRQYTTETFDRGHRAAFDRL